MGWDGNKVFRQEGVDQPTVASKRSISGTMRSLSLDTEQLPWVLPGSQSLSSVRDTVPGGSSQIPD